MAPRGIRNNNPGNIEYGPFARSMGATGSDGRFAIFPTPAHGIRAIAALQTRYENKHGLNSPYERINRWAPAFENNVNSYANAVAKGMGVGVNDPFSFVDLNMDDDVQFIAAMIQHENGRQPYSLEDIRAALDNGATPPSPATGSRAASGLQGFLPPSTVPEPRLRPDPSSVRDPFQPPTGASRPPASAPPVPPEPIPNFDPVHSVPAGPYGADNVIKAALTGNPAALKVAADETLGMNTMFPVGAMAMRSGELTEYFSAFARTQPALANQVAANLRGNPAMVEALPEAARGGVIQALSGGSAALPGNQVPTPTLRPPAPSAPTTPPASTFPARPAVIPSNTARTSTPASSVSDAFIQGMSQYRPMTAPRSSGSSSIVPALSDDEKTILRAPAPATVTRPASPPATTAPKPISQQQFDQRFNAAPAPAVGSRAASETQGYTPPAAPSVSSAFVQGMSQYRPMVAQPAPQPVYQYIPQQPITRPTAVLNPAWSEWERTTQANPELRSILKAPPQWIDGPMETIPQQPKKVLVQPQQQPAKPRQTGGGASATRETTDGYNKSTPGGTPYKTSTSGGTTTTQYTKGGNTFVLTSTPDGRTQTQKVGSSGGSSSSSTVLCTYFMKKGWLSKELWRADGQFAKTLPMAVRRGYWKWAIPTVRRLQNGAPVLERILWPVVKAWAQYAAYRMGAVDRFPLSGWVVHRVGTMVRA